MIGDLRLRIQTEKEGDLPRLRDKARECLEAEGVTVIDANAVRQSRTFFVAASVHGSPTQIEVEAMDEKDAVKQVKGKGTVVIGVSETPITPADG